MTSAGILAIDCGNTRIKWGMRYAHAGDWHALGAAPLAEIARLALDWAALPPPSRIVIANVAGEAARAALDAPLRRFTAAPEWISARASQCGVSNGYADPGQLGPDRWAALIGAWHMQGGACLVVNAGTATTADMLSSQGQFRGGIIIPGVDLMKRALAAHTAGLPYAQGVLSDSPRCTADAIESGCLYAQAGAIERMYARLEAGAVCVLSGGAAARLEPVLNIPLRRVDNLALEGLVRIGS